MIYFIFFFCVCVSSWDERSWCFLNCHTENYCLFPSGLSGLSTKEYADLWSSLKVNSSLRTGLRVYPIYHLGWAFISLLYSYFLPKDAHPVRSYFYHVFTWFFGRPLSSIEAQMSTWYLECNLSVHPLMHLSSPTDIVRKVYFSNISFVSHSNYVSSQCLFCHPFTQDLSVGYSLFPSLLLIFIVSSDCQILQTLTPHYAIPKVQRLLFIT